VKLLTEMMVSQANAGATFGADRFAGSFCTGGAPIGFAEWIFPQTV
jgi:hypothetical protein